MFNLIVFVIVYLISTGVLLLEEEVLILIASIFWLDAAGHLIKNYINLEVENRGLVIKDKILWYYNKRIELLKELREFHTNKVNMIKDFENIYNMYLWKLVDIVLNNYKKTELIILQYEYKKKIVELGLYVINEIWIEKLEKILVQYKHRDSVVEAFGKELKSK